MDYKLKLNLKAFKNAGVMNIKGVNSAKRCVVIPIDDNFMFEGAKGVYVDCFVNELKEPRDNNTHYIKLNAPKAAKEKMSDEERKSLPIVGNLSTWQSNNGQQQSTAPQKTPEAESNPNDDDLPF